VRRFWHRPLGSKLILLLSLSLLVIMLVAPWQRTCQVRPSLEALCGRVYAWEGSDFGIYALLLVIAVLVWELLPVLTPRLSMRGWPTAVVTAVLGVAIVVCVIVKMIEDNEFQTGWAWVCFALALAIMLTAIVRVRFRWEMRHRRPDEETPRTAPEPDAGAGS
jgi:hypothetical protein